jgi:hypothetical protein
MVTLINRIGFQNDTSSLRARCVLPAYTNSTNTVHVEPELDASSLITTLGFFGITFSTRRQVELFLNQYAELTDSLYDLPKIISHYFSVDTRVSFRVFTSAEDDEPIPELHISIDSNLEHAQARQKLKEMRRDWVYKLDMPGSEFVHLTLM